MASLRIDVAVVGGGPAGLAAAAAAAATGASVVMINDGADVGGQIWRHDIAGAPPSRARELFRRVQDSAVARLHQSTVVNARRTDDGFVLTVERHGIHDDLSVGRIVLTTGARELFLPFPGWTLPGVLGVGAVQAMAKGGFDVRGKRIVIAGSGPLLVAVAASLAKRGAKILLIAEQAPLSRMLSFSLGLVRAPRLALDALGYLKSIRPGAFRFGTWVSAAEGDGANAVRRVTITDGRNPTAIDCDLVCVGYGLVPNTELAQLLGCELSPRGIAVDEKQQTSVPGVFAAGECVGIAGVDAALAEGAVAGGQGPMRATPRAWARRLESTFALRPELFQLATPETIICRCEDVRLGAIDPSWTARQAKLYARVGMGPCQGRICGPALQHLRGLAPDRVRAPIYPSFMSTFVKRRVDLNTTGVE